VNILWLIGDLKTCVWVSPGIHLLVCIVVVGQADMWEAYNNYAKCSSL